MKKGFTLMEVLAVVLILAVIFSFGVPAWRAVRFDMKNAQAHEAAQKLAEAMRSFYRDNRGQHIAPTCFTAADINTSVACSGDGAIGKPVGDRSSGWMDAAASVDMLFACKYLNLADWKDIPYIFCVSPDESRTDRIPSEDPPSYMSPYGSYRKYWVTACGADDKKAGAKYTCGNNKLKGYIYVDGHMKVSDTY